MNYEVVDGTSFVLLDCWGIPVIKAIEIRVTSLFVVRNLTDTLGNRNIAIP
jgi:hypothetical protein